MVLTSNNLEGTGFITSTKRSCQHPEVWLNDSKFANDIALLVNSTKDAQTQAKNLAETAKEVGLIINTDKTEVMKINISSSNDIVICKTTLMMYWTSSIWVCILLILFMT